MTDKTPEQTPPETLEGLQELIGLQQRAGAFDAAATVLQAYLQQHPDSLWTLSELCRCLLRLARYEEAGDVLATLRTQTPDAPTLAALEGLQHQLRDEPDAAKQRYQKALNAAADAASNESDAHEDDLLWAAYNLAKLHGDSDENEACETWLDHIIARQEGHFAARFQRALLYSRTLRAEEAQQELAATINANPLMLQPYLLLAEVRLRDGDPEAATETLLHGLQANPLAHPLREALARVFAVSGDTEAAFGVRLEICRLRGRPEDFLDLGEAALVMGSQEHAVIAFTKAINEAPKDWRGYYNLAEMRRAHGDYIGALPLYENALKYGPNDRVHNGIAMYYLEVEGERNDPAKALEHIEEALRLHPIMPAAMFNHVLVLAVLRRPDDAKETLAYLRQNLIPDHPLQDGIPQLEDAIKIAQQGNNGAITHTNDTK